MSEETMSEETVQLTVAELVVIYKGLRAVEYGWGTVQDRATDSAFEKILDALKNQGIKK